MVCSRQDKEAKKPKSQINKYANNEPNSKCEWCHNEISLLNWHNKHEKHKNTKKLNTKNQFLQTQSTFRWNEKHATKKHAFQICFCGFTLKV